MGLVSLYCYVILFIAIVVPLVSGGDALALGSNVDARLVSYCVIYYAY